MTRYDYAVVGFYFLYMLAVGWSARRMVRNVNDYYRSGGQVLWWMAGGSAFMLSFSAWTFTGAASRAYADGWPVMVIYLGNAIGFAGACAYFAPRMRQLRVMTSMQMVRTRFGTGNEQFFTWLTMVMRILYGGIWLYGLGVFLSAALGLNVTFTILMCGGTVVVISLVGGSWAVVVSDFIQVLILMPVTLVAAVLAVHRLGGAAAFVHALGPTRLDWGKLASQRFLPFWCLAILAKQFIATNNPGDTPRYFCVKDSRHARKAAALGGLLMLVGVVIFFVPPMAASAVFPDLGAMYPALANPGEGSFFAIATATFPTGMIGLLVCGVFAATMSAMDGGLNSNSGIFIKNFYQPILRPGAGERELLFAGKVTTGILGLAIIALAQFYSQFPQLSLFQLMVDFGILVALPHAMPLFLGLFIRRTPPWSGWSTVLLGFLSSLAAYQVLTVEWAVRLFGGHPQMSSWERLNWSQAVTATLVLVVCTGWFCLSKLFYRTQPAEVRSRIEEFSARIDTPVDHEREEGGKGTDDIQSWLIGRLCLPYGAVICLMALIPNSAAGRLAFLFCGLVLLAIGAALLASTRRPTAAAFPANPGSAAPAHPRAHRIRTLLVAITPQEAADFLPGILWTELAGLADRTEVVDPSDLTAEQFHRELERLNPEVLVACWKTPPLPPDPPTGLQYVCYLAGSVKKLLKRPHLDRGLIVSNWGGSISRVVAECALMMTLAALRRTGYWIPAMQRDGAWKDAQTETGSLFGRRVGIHGFGQVAREITKLLRPFEVDIEICAPETDEALYEAHGARRMAGLEQLFAECDVIIEAAPLIPDTAGIITEALLRLIRPGGIFVNVGRGGLVDEEALERVAREGRILVALDVYGIEPLPAESGLRGLPNAILLPHLAGPTTDRRRDAGAFGLSNLKAYAAGRPLESVITTDSFDRHS